METENIHEPCGARKPNWPRFGPLNTTLDNNASTLVQFFQGEFDVVKCEVCGGPLITPSIVVSFDNYAEDLVFYGSQAREHPEDIRAIEEDAKAKGTTVVSDFDSPSELREAAWQRLSPRAARVYQALDSFIIDASDASQWEQTWPQLTSSTFAAAVVALKVGLPLFNFDEKTGERIRKHIGEQGLRGLQQLQARVWYSVCSRWKASAPFSGTLDEDLKAYVNPWAIIAGAPESFFESLESLDLKSLDPATQYALEATNAGLCASLGAPNPRADQWASLYLIIEELRSKESRTEIVDALAVSNEWARNTVDRQALAAAVTQWLAKQADEKFQNLSGQQNAIQAAVTKAGYPSLLGDAFVGARMQWVGGKDFDSKDIAQLIGNTVQIFSSQPAELEAFLDLIRQSLPSAIDAEELIAIIKRSEDTLTENYLARTILRFWLGRILCMRRQPTAFLDLIGAEPESWERDVPLAHRAVLWLWRARALRSTGHSFQALSLLKSLEEENEVSATKLPDHVRQMVMGDTALDYVNLGYFETALQIQTALLEEPGVAQSPWHLRAVATTYEMLGRDQDAIPLLQEALSVDTRQREIGHLLEAQLANVLMRCHRAEEAFKLLEGIPDDELKNPEVFIFWSGAWLNAPSDGSSMRDRLLSVAKTTSELVKSSLAEGDTQLHMVACRMFAAITERFEGKNRGVWEMVDSGARDFEGSPDPEALLTLSLSDWENGDFTSGRKKLLEFPEALARRFADTRDVAVSAKSLEQLDHKLRAIGDYVVSSGVTGSDIHLVAELQRDLLGRIAARATPDLASGFIAPDDEETVRIAAGSQSIGVLEWVSGTSGVHWLFSRVSAEGEVERWWLTSPELDLVSLSKKVNQRLSVWQPDRTGDPFDLDGWKAFENWLAKELDGRLPDGSHLLVIENQEVADLQWHVAAAPRWRTSYAPSWTAVLNARRIATSTKEGPIGLAMVPAYHESAENLRALESSVSRTVELAATLGRELKSALREACDRDALMQVLGASTVAKVLCHGFVDPNEDIVALIVANHGALFPASSVAMNTPGGRRHRFDWRDCRYLQSAPAVIFSAACSSGQSHHIGVGERLGLFSALRRSGTRSFIAPRWDINPEAVLPILDNTLERYLRTGDELGEALHLACSDASKEQPPWLAWSLALEGDWR